MSNCRSQMQEPAAADQQSSAAAAYISVSSVSNSCVPSHASCTGMIITLTLWYHYYEN